MTEPFVEMLRGATNTLGRSPEVVELVKADPERIDELFELYFQPDEWVRLRSSNSLRRLWREDHSWIAAFIDRWISDVATIDQPSVQWTFAQVLNECPELFTEDQAQAAELHVRRYLETSDDWIVLNASIEALGNRAKTDDALRAYLLPHLDVHAESAKKSIAKRAQKMLSALTA